MLYHTVPKLCTLCHVETRMLHCPVYYLSPCLCIQSQGYPPMVIDWTPTIGHIPCQTQPGPAHEPWSCWEEATEKPPGQGYLRSLFHRGHIFEVCSIHLLSTFKSSCPWVLTRHLLLN